MRNGRLVGSAATADLPRLKLISLMLGRELERTEERARCDSPRSGKRSSRFSSRKASDGGASWRRSTSPFGPGEVVGLAGLLGSGRTEVAKLIFGAVRSDSGRLDVGGGRVTTHSPGQSLRLGMAFCPEDRKAEGMFGELTVRENIILGLADQARMAAAGSRTTSRRSWRRR